MVKFVLIFSGLPTRISSFLPHILSVTCFTKVRKCGCVSLSAQRLWCANSLLHWISLKKRHTGVATCCLILFESGWDSSWSSALSMLLVLLELTVLLRSWLIAGVKHCLISWLYWISNKYISSKVPFHTSFIKILVPRQDIRHKEVGIPVSLNPSPVLIRPLRFLMRCIPLLTEIYLVPIPTAEDLLKIW